MEIEKLRDDISRIDNEIARLLEERMKITEKIGKEKSKKGFFVRDAKREREIIKTLSEKAESPALKGMITQIYKTIFSYAHAFQMPRIAFQGERGAYSEEAAEKAFARMTPVPCKSFAEAFDAIESGKADFAVLPIENSIYGSVGEVCDLLFERNVFVSGEIFHEIKHCLGGKDGSKEVFSHPQALGQCSVFIESRSLSPVPYYDTAGAAKDMGKRALVIASKKAMEIYGLKIIEENIGNRKDNVTRFLVISKAPADDGEKGSVIFTVKHKPGSLFEALKAFKDNSINLTKIESRPLGGWEYAFFVDFEKNEKSDRSLKMLEKSCTRLKFLGYYSEFL